MLFAIYSCDYPHLGVVKSELPTIINRFLFFLFFFAPYLIFVECSQYVIFNTGILSMQAWSDFDSSHGPDVLDLSVSPSLFDTAIKHPPA